MQFGWGYFNEEELVYIMMLVDILRGADLAAAYVIKNNIKAYYSMVKQGKRDDEGTHGS